MSLFTSYSDANKIVSTGRTTRYESTPNNYVNSIGESKTLYWTVRRYSGQSYTYVGMTKAAAETCATAMHEKYTRAYAEWEARTKDVDGSAFPEVVIDKLYPINCSATISLTHVEGNAWEVGVSENDVDTIISTDELTTTEQFAALFQLAEERSSGNPTILSVERYLNGVNTMMRASLNFENESDIDTIVNSPEGEASERLKVVSVYFKNSAGQTDVADFVPSDGVTFVKANPHALLVTFPKAASMPTPTAKIVKIEIRIIVTTPSRAIKYYRTPSTSGIEVETSAPPAIVIDSATYSVGLIDQWSNPSPINFVVKYHGENMAGTQMIGMASLMSFFYEGKQYLNRDIFNSKEYFTIAPDTGAGIGHYILTTKNITVKSADRYNARPIPIQVSGSDVPCSTYMATAATPWVRWVSAPTCTYTIDTYPYKATVTGQFTSSLAPDTVLANMKLKHGLSGQQGEFTKVSLTQGVGELSGTYTYEGYVTSSASSAIDVFVSIDDGLGNTATSPSEYVAWQGPNVALSVSSAVFDNDHTTISFANASVPARIYSPASVIVERWNETLETPAWETMVVSSRSSSQLVVNSSRVEPAMRLKFVSATEGTFYSRVFNATEA